MVDKSLMSFKTLKNFTEFCEKSNINPILDIDVKKHSNMRGEFFHFISGELKLNETDFNFKIKEPLVLKSKLYKQKGNFTYADLLV